MAALVVQSRFAGLKIEDDDYPPSADNQKSKKSKTNTAKKADPQKKTKNNNTVKPQNAPAKKKKSKPNASSEQDWELWKQKDEQLVDGNYETELHQAILLSKLDFEEKKDVYKQMKKEADIKKKSAEQNVRSSAKSEKKQRKKNVMSLDQFNDMVKNGGEDSKPPQDGDSCPADDPGSPNKDTEFFERVKDETKNELIKDKMNDTVRNRLAVSEEIISRVQFADALERKDKEILVLRQEVTDLKQELVTVKSRNRKLCNILGQGEMKDKAEVLVEVERLRGVQAELTAELAELHTHLEKERSRNTEPKTKDKKHPNKKKNIRFDVSSEALLTKEASSGTG